MNPNVFDIIKTSLAIAKKIIFFLPRTLQLEELYSIIEKVQRQKNEVLPDVIFDVHILNSANKIKALMIIFSNDMSTV